jgi:hypothetical protein
VASELPRQRDDGVSNRGVCFAAGSGLSGVGAGGLKDGLPGRRWPRHLRPHRHRRRRDMADQSGVWAGRGKDEPDARRHLDNPRAEFQEPQADGGELGGGERVCLGDGVAWLRPSEWSATGMVRLVAR